MTNTQTEWLRDNDISHSFAMDYTSGIDKLRPNRNIEVFSRGVYSVTVINRTKITCSRQAGPTTWYTHTAGSLQSGLRWLVGTDATRAVGNDTCG